MINENNEAKIKNLINYNILYPLVVTGYDGREYKIRKIYINSDRVMMQLTVRGIDYIERLSNYSQLFQDNLINQLKQFNNSIWND